MCQTARCLHDWYVCMTGADRPLAVVTGASSGIGAAFARRLAGEGYDLIVVARREGRLQQLADVAFDVTVEVIVADLANDAGIDLVAVACADRPLSMLVNNAGLAHYMPPADLPAEKAREIIQVKVTAPTLLTRATLPGMIKRGAGTIVTIAGMLAFGGPAAAAAPRSQRALYTGTLAGVVAMTQTLQAELSGTGVSVHVVCGWVRNDLPCPRCI